MGLKYDEDRSSKGYDLVFDVVARRNRNVRFFPAQGNLQGEVNISQISSDKVPGYLNQVGGWIPGYQIQIDTKGRKARIVDRLKQEDHAPILEKCRVVHATAMNGAFAPITSENFKREGDVVDEAEFEMSDDPSNSLATWLYHCWNLQRRNKLTLIKGKLPTLDEIFGHGDPMISIDHGLAPKPGREKWNFASDYMPKTEQSFSAS